MPNEPSTSAVKVVKKKCSQVAAIIESLQFPETLIRQNFHLSSKECVGNFNLFLVALCHQTQRLEGKVEGQDLRGWDYLEARLAESFMTDPTLFDMRTWPGLSKTDLRHYLRCEKSSITENDMQKRVALIHDLAQRLMSQNITSLWELLQKCEYKCVTGSNPLFSVLNTTQAYADPLQKKSKLLVAILRDVHDWQFNDIDKVSAPVDYHEIRGHLRIGTVKILSKTIRRKMADKVALSYEEDLAVRKGVSDAIDAIAAELKNFDALKLHYVFWYMFRYICLRSEPLCHNLGPLADQGSGSAFEVFKDVQLGRGCPFASICQSTNSPAAPIEYDVDTDFY